MDTTLPSPPRCVSVAVVQQEMSECSKEIGVVCAGFRRAKGLLALLRAVSRRKKDTPSAATRLSNKVATAAAAATQALAAAEADADADATAAAEAVAAAAAAAVAAAAAEPPTTPARRGRAPAQPAAAPLRASDLLEPAMAEYWHSSRKWKPVYVLGKSEGTGLILCIQSKLVRKSAGDQMLGAASVSSVALRRSGSRSRSRSGAATRSNVVEIVTTRDVADVVKLRFANHVKAKGVVETLLREWRCDVGPGSPPRASAAPAASSSLTSPSNVPPAALSGASTPLMDHRAAVRCDPTDYYRYTYMTLSLSCECEPCSQF